MRILGMFPRSWKTGVTVLRGGGRDPKGNPLPTQEIARPAVLVGPRATSEPLDHSDVTDGRAVLYDDDTSFTYLHSDQIRVPEGARMAGLWSVDGRPGEWPFGSEVGLVRG